MARQSLQKRISELESWLQKARLENDSYRRKLEEAEKVTTGQRELLAQANDGIESLNKTLDAANKGGIALTKRLEDCEARKKDYCRDKELLKRQNEALQRTVNAMKATINAAIDYAVMYGKPDE